MGQQGMPYRKMRLIVSQVVILRSNALYLFTAWSIIFELNSCLGTDPGQGGGQDPPRSKKHGGEEQTDMPMTKTIPPEVELLLTCSSQVPRPPGSAPASFLEKLNL